MEKQNVTSYTAQVKDSDGLDIATMRYDFVMGNTAQDISLEFKDGISEEIKKRITQIKGSSVNISLPAQLGTDFKLRVYKPGTLSHFVLLSKKLESYGFLVEYDKQSTEFQKEIMDAL